MYFGLSYSYTMPYNFASAEKLIHWLEYRHANGIPFSHAYPIYIRNKVAARTTSSGQIKIIDPRLKAKLRVHISRGSGIGDLFKSIPRRVKSLFTNSVRAPPSVREAIERAKDEVIVGITIGKKPINTTVEKVVRSLSGAIIPYEKLMHLWITFTFRSSSPPLTFEKNEILAVSQGMRDGERFGVSLHGAHPTLGTYFDKQIAKIGAEDWARYDPTYANCQIWVQSGLEANGFSTRESTAFILQPMQDIMPSFFKKLSRTLTDIYGRTKNALLGTGLDGGSIFVPEDNDQDFAAWNAYYGNRGTRQIYRNILADPNQFAALKREWGYIQGIEVNWDVPAPHFNNYDTSSDEDDDYDDPYWGLDMDTTRSKLTRPQGAGMGGKMFGGRIEDVTDELPERVGELLVMQYIIAGCDLSDERLKEIANDLMTLWNEDFQAFNWKYGRSLKTIKEEFPWLASDLKTPWLMLNTERKRLDAKKRPRPTDEPKPSTSSGPSPAKKPSFEPKPAFVPKASYTDEDRTALKPEVPLPTKLSAEPFDPDNLYSRLGLTPKATPAEIKAQYIKKIRTEHTDKGGDKDKAQKMTDAYNFLKDRETREVYDSVGHKFYLYYGPQKVKRMYGVRGAGLGGTGVDYSTGKIYIITNGNGQAYIGSTRDSLERRLAQHYKFPHGELEEFLQGPDVKIDLLESTPSTSLKQLKGYESQAIKQFLKNRSGLQLINKQDPLVGGVIGIHHLSDLELVNMARQLTNERPINFAQWHRLAYAIQRNLLAWARASLAESYAPREWVEQ